jgi:hypothetical protein
VVVDEAGDDEAKWFHGGHSKAGGLFVEKS